jgi:hypothetical protein
LIERDIALDAAVLVPSVQSADRGQKSAHGEARRAKRHALAQAQYGFGR